MFSKLDQVESRYEEVNMALQRPDVASDQKQYRALMKELSDLEKIVVLYRDFKKKTVNLKDSKELLTAESDAEMKEMIREEIKELEEALPNLEHQLKIALIPKDPNDDKNILLEIRAGAGGDEASLFADELFRAYAKYASDQGWKAELMSYTDGNVGGAKEVIAMISGDAVFSKMKFESGVHRVQRVPETESGGRVHTSAATVAVLPQAEEVDIEIRNEDIRIDTMRASGAGGQHVNTTDSAVRITHIPTGVVVVQAEKSQHQNRARAMEVLRARLYDMERQKAAEERSENRRLQVGSGDRSERIRTYNFPQGRVTDHRINLTLYKLDRIMEGDLNDVIDPLIADYQANLLTENLEG